MGDGIKKTALLKKETWPTAVKMVGAYANRLL